MRLNLGDHFDTNELQWSLPTWASANIKEVPPGSDWDFLQIGSNNGDIDDSLQYRRSRSSSYNFGAKFCFPIGPFITCIGASYFNASGNGAVHTAFEDVDGDGYVDQGATVDDDPTGLTYVKLNLAGCRPTSSPACTSRSEATSRSATRAKATSSTTRRSTPVDESRPTPTS